MADAMRLMLNEAMRIERFQALEAGPYQRTEKRRAYANCFKPNLLRKRVGELALQVPQVRGDVEFYLSALEQGVRSERALKCAIAEMYVTVVSTRKVTALMSELCGLEVFCTQVSRATRLLDEELNKRCNRSLGEMPYVFLDAPYEKIRRGGSVVSSAVLMAFGVDESGHRTVLGVSVSPSEVEVHWRDFFAGLQARGLAGVRLLISDDHAGLTAAREARFSGVPWTRCLFQLQQDAAQHAPRLEMRRQVAAGLRAIFESTDRLDAERRLSQTVDKYAQRVPKLGAWMEDVADSFHCVYFPVHASLALAHFDLDGASQQRTEAPHAWPPSFRTKPRCFVSPVQCSWKSAKNGRPKNLT